MAIRALVALLVLATVTGGVALVARSGETLDPSETVEASKPVRPARTAARPARPRPPWRVRADGTTRVPILMYHVLGDMPERVRFSELWVRRADFIAQMRWLEQNGYHAVTLRAVRDHWHGGAPLPSRPVVVSFDDGFRSTALVALPVLSERGWPGVLNLALHHLGPSWGLSERRIRELIAAGWEIDAHTLTHPDLTSVDDRRLEREVAGSRKQIQQRFGVAVDFFCYPSGRYDERVIAAVRRAGYLGATTTVDGWADRDEPFTLRRVRVSRSDGLPGFVSSLQGRPRTTRIPAESSNSRRAT